MPTIRVSIPADLMDALKKAAVERLVTVNDLIVEAATERAQRVLAERKHIKVVR